MILREQSPRVSLAIACGVIEGEHFTSDAAVTKDSRILDQRNVVPAFTDRAEDLDCSFSAIRQFTAGGGET